MLSQVVDERKLEILDGVSSRAQADGYGFQREVHGREGGGHSGQGIERVDAARSGASGEHHERDGAQLDEMGSGGQGTVSGLPDADSGGSGGSAGRGDGIVAFGGGGGLASGEGLGGVPGQAKPRSQPLCGPD